MFHRLIKGLVPVAAIAAAFATAGCDGSVSINGNKGVPLAELDSEGKSASAIVLAGPDTVVVSRGSDLKIDVSGDPRAVEALRFALDDQTLSVMRAKDAGKIDGTARVAVTLPKLEKVVIAGSGSLEAPSLTGAAEVVIAGSGTARTDAVDASSLEVTIAGTGTYHAAGSSSKLELTVAGSGEADMAGLSVEDAEVTIAGSGTAAFASDGTVKATVMGSGDVTVTGQARCTITSMGSGTLNCNSAAQQRTAGGQEPPAAPTAPSAPAAPGAPATPASPEAPAAPEAPKAPE